MTIRLDDLNELRRQAIQCLDALQEIALQNEASDLGNRHSPDRRSSRILVRRINDLCRNFTKAAEAIDGFRLPRNQRLQSAIFAGHSLQEDKKRPRHTFCLIAHACSEAFKKHVDEGGELTLEVFCLDYARKNTGGPKGTTLWKKLKDNRETWDPKGRYKNVRSPKPKRVR